MWTTHGHQIIGTIALDPVSNLRPRVGRCGGPTGGCRQCEIESGQAQKDAGRDGFGNKIEGADESQPAPKKVSGFEALESAPTLEETASLGRMLGRVRAVLLITRPMEEVDLICDRFAMMLAEHKVMMEHFKVDPETLKNLPREFSDEKTMEKVRAALEKFTDKDRAVALTEEMQSAGILFREALIS